MAKWPKALQVAHVGFYTSVVTLPWIVTSKGGQPNIVFTVLTLCSCVLGTDLSRWELIL